MAQAILRHARILWAADRVHLARSGVRHQQALAAGGVRCPRVRHQQEDIQQLVPLDSIGVQAQRPVNLQATQTAPRVAAIPPVPAVSICAIMHVLPMARHVIITHIIRQEVPPSVLQTNISAPLQIPVYPWDLLAAPLALKQALNAKADFIGVRKQIAVFLIRRHVVPQPCNHKPQRLHAANAKYRKMGNA